MPSILPLLESIHTNFGNGVFITISVIVSLLLSFVAIPLTTHLMVNSTAGLAGKYFGPKSRTLFINASTNNPEAFSMFASFSIGRMGGWSNPFGSLLANIYLMYGVALIYVSVKFLVKGELVRLRELYRLLALEWRLVLVHLSASVITFVVGFAALRVMMIKNEEPTVGLHVVTVAGLIAFGIIAFMIADRFLKSRRPELFDDIDSASFNESWPSFFFGTAGVIISCYLMNELFLAWTQIYSEGLSRLFGASMIFAWLHYFLGALITSLPEMTVAVHNYEKTKAPDLNTALGSVSYSNMVNLAICLVGLGIWLFVSLFGVQFTWQ